MNRLDIVLQSILQNHNFEQCTELKEWIDEAIVSKTITFSLFLREGRYYMSLFMPKRDYSALLEVTKHLMQLLICPQLNPTRHVSYYSNEGALYAYCEAITNYEKANVMAPLTEARITIDRANNYTSVEFVSEHYNYPHLHVKFMF